MTDFGDLTRDLGIRQQGKSAPMSASKPSSSSSIGSRSANYVAADESISGYKYPNPNLNPQLNSMPVYDKPVYDNDDVFGSTSKGGHVDADDLLRGSGSGSKRSGDLGGFEDLIPGFGGSSRPNQREPEINQQKSADPYGKSSANMSEDPFAVFESTSSPARYSEGMSTNSLEELGRSMKPGSSNVNASSVNGGIFDDNGAFDGFAKSVPVFTSEKNETMKGTSPLEFGPRRSDERCSGESLDNAIPRTRTTKSFDSRSSVQSPTSNNSPYKRSGTEDQSPTSSEYLERADVAWLTVAEIPLFTEPTRGPPPSRQPPPLSMKSKPYGRADLRRKGKESELRPPSTSSYLYPEGSESSEVVRDEETTLHARDLGGREQREREERDREQKILDKERDVERENAARANAERAAVEKANAEARRRADRAAAQRAAAEARERAFAEAQEKVARDQANAKAREKAAAEARLRAERERAAAAAAREKLYKAENDLEAFFGMSSRPASAPKQRATTSENFFDSQAPSRRGADGAWRTYSASSVIRKTSTTNIADDLTSIFGGASSSGEFQEVEGESEDRRRARYERHLRTQERTMKALAEKNERDVQTQMEQAEKHKIAEALDGEIKLWSRGKENNLRALLSSLEYILWPECGWQPVPLTDLVTAAAVKKVYRKATLCIHPDKVQQKGANLQQKCIAEKVFDILKEAWNKFNSEELF